MNPYENPNEPHDDIAKDLTNEMMNQGKKFVVKMGKSSAKRVKKMFSRGVKRAGKAFATACLKAGASLLKVLAPYFAIIFLILFVVIAGYYLLFETRGAEGNYLLTKISENVMEFVDNYFKSKELSSENKAIVEFYQYFGREKSFYQILGDDNTKLEQTEGANEIRDYYDKEKQFAIDADFLFALDEYVFKNNFRYPEQFVQPVNYDPKTLTLKSLTNKSGAVIAESKKYAEDGKPTKEKEKSVHDYGLASIFKYKKDEEVYTVEGYYYQKDVWDEDCQCVKQVPTHENFSAVLPGYPKTIYLITKAITFVGEFEFAYDKQKTVAENMKLEDGVGTENSTKIKVEYAKKDVYKDCEKTDENGETYTDKCYVKTVHLYKYKKGNVYKTVPVENPSKNKEHKIGQDYLYDYLLNFKSYVPESVMQEFDFISRVGSILDSDIQKGSQKNSANVLKAMQYSDIVTKYAEQYGVDPYLVIAVIAQESGGNANASNGGLMQIAGSGSRTIKTKNVKTGKTDSFTLTNRSDPDQNIHFGVMLLASLINKYNDVLKGLQSYNYDIGNIKEIAPESWNSGSLDWMNYREEARIQRGYQELGKETRSVNYSCIPDKKKDSSLTRYGDSCYIEDVLRYYAGDGFKGIEKIDTDKASGLKGLLNKLKDSVSSFFSINKKTYQEDEPRFKFEHLMSKKEIDWLLRSDVTFNDQILFSDAETGGDLQFWEDGFTTKDSSFSSREEFINAVPDANGYYPPVAVKKPVISSKFGYRTHPTKGVTKFHKGVDVAVPRGTSVYTIADGKVIVANTGCSEGDYSCGGGYGNWIQIQHKDGSKTTYGHLSEVYVKVGDTVKAGQLIGASGSTGDSTGPHLHFEYIKDGKYLDPYYIVVRSDS